MVKFTIDLDENYFTNECCHHKLSMDGNYCSTIQSYKQMISYINWVYYTKLLKKMYKTADILKYPIITNEKFAMIEDYCFETLDIDLEKLFTIYLELLLNTHQLYYYSKLYISKEDFLKSISSHIDLEELLKDDFTISLKKDNCILIDLDVIYKPSVIKSYIK